MNLFVFITYISGLIVILGVLALKIWILVLVIQALLKWVG